MGDYNAAVEEATFQMARLITCGVYVTVILQLYGSAFFKGGTTAPPRFVFPIMRGPGFKPSGFVGSVSKNTA